VLLVEDNLRVRAVAYEALQRHGYRVLETGEAARAIEIIDATPRLDALVSDLVLRDGDGLVLARRLRSRHPDAGALIMSGYAPSDEDRVSLRRQEFPLLQKPFTPRELVAAVAKAISGGLERERRAAG
jgi:DNA-binding NtrC family response regulator